MLDLYLIRQRLSPDRTRELFEKALAGRNVLKMSPYELMLIHDSVLAQQIGEAEELLNRLEHKEL